MDTEQWASGIPIDERLAISLAVIFLASFAKGVAGLGIPMIATPIIASMYGLREAIAIVALPMALSDMPFVVRGSRHYREARLLIPFILFGLVGVFIGARLLVTVDEQLLGGLLGGVIALFVVIAWFDILPTINQSAAKVLGPPCGLIAGIVQGSAGASGPLSTMYLFSLGMPRHVFLFSVNAIFQVMDATQFIALHQVGLYSAPLMQYTVVACLPMSAGVFLGLKAQKYVNDRLFRRVVLVLLGLSSINLFARALAGG